MIMLISQWKLRLLDFAFILIIIALPRIYSVGLDTINLDDKHFQNVSYNFSQLLDNGKFDELYLTVQPAVITMYTNTIGFKSFYFLKDKVNYLNFNSIKDENIALRSALQIPKTILIVFLMSVLLWQASIAYNRKFAYLFLYILSTEPFFLGMSRMMHTDTVPALLIILVTLLIKNYYLIDSPAHARRTIIISAILLGLATTEKASTLIVVPAFILYFLHFSKFTNLTRKKCLLNFTVFFITSVIIFFPVFWERFWESWYDLIIGSFIEGALNQDYESKTYMVNQEQNLDLLFYFKFLSSQLSIIIILGLMTYIYNFKKLYKNEKIKYLELSVPVIFFVAHLISAKKVPSYLTLLFPFMALFSSRGIIYTLKKNQIFSIFCILAIMFRTYELKKWFPDYASYENGIIKFQSYNPTTLGWGDGGKRLGEYLNKTYGPNETIMISDPYKLYYFYSGNVKIENDLSKCDYDFSLYIGTSKTTDDKCFSNKLVLIDQFKTHRLKTYFIFRNSDTIK